MPVEGSPGCRDNLWRAGGGTIKEALDLNYASVFADTSTAQGDARPPLITDPQCGKRFILSELRLRLHSYYQLPVRPLGIGHWGVRKARESSLLAMAEFDHYGPDGGKSKALFARGPTSLRRRIIDPIHGAHIQGYPALELFQAKTRFALNSELAIERAHAQLHRDILSAPNHSEAYAPSALRQT